MNKSSALHPLSLGVLFALGYGGMASAQETTLETIIVSSDRSENIVGDVPASIHVVDADMIDLIRHVHVGELMNTVPGVVFNRNNGQESFIGIRSPILTGAGSCGSVQVAQDGIPVRGAGFCNVNQLFDANSEQAGSIEVIRGPGSVLFGVNALHGAVNVISPTLSDERGGAISLDAGPHDYGRLNINYGTGGNDHSFGVFANIASDGGYKEQSGFDQTKINVAHSYTGSNVQITTVLAATDLDQETAGYLSAGFEAYKIDALKKTNSNPEAFRNVEGLRLHSRIEGNLDNGSWMVTPYYRDTDMAFLMHFFPGDPLEENGHESFGVQSMISRDISDSVNWKFGLDVEMTDGFLKQTQDGGFGPFPDGRQYDYQVDAELLSPFAIGTFQVSASDQLSVGLRYEQLEYDYDNRMIDGNTDENGVPCPGIGCRYSRPSDRTDDFDNFTAQLGWIHSLGSESQFFANIATAFRAPQATELYRLQQTQQVADLDSEEVDSIEFGYRAGRSGLSYGVAAYYVNKENVIFQDSGRNNISGQESKHRGLELDAIAELTENLSLTVVATYARHTYESNPSIPSTLALDGNDMDTAPKLIGNVQLDWELNESNSLNFEWVHMGSYYTDETNLHKYAGHDLMNLRYRYDSPNSWYFAARVLNLFDEDYAERADWTSFQQDRYFVGEPASVYFTVGSRF